MTFAAPWALVGLLCAAIPLLLHLFARREPPTVIFPATRYLADTARMHQRRLHLQHFLLLLVRTLLVVALVLAAAGPTSPGSGIGAHGPSGLVLVLDNSPSSGAVQGGTPVFAELREAARSVLARATAADRLWLLTADGIPRSGGASALRGIVDSLAPSPRRLDLGVAVGLAREVLASEPRPGEVLVLSDLQRTALSAAPGRGGGALTVARPRGPAVANAGVVGLGAGSQPWGPDGGTASVQVGGTPARGRSVPLTLGIGGRLARQLLAPVGGQVSVRLPSPVPGWWTLKAELEPDELRRDDTRAIALRVAPAARVSWRPEDRYLAAAAEVLAQSGRIVRGTDVVLGGLGPAAAIVTPPSDPASLGALNRALAARGSEWRYGDLELVSTVTDSSAWLGRERVLKRYALLFRGGAPRGVLITAGGSPWLARSGSVVLAGSRFEPDWTSLPLSAAFVPLVDALVNRAARGETVLLEAAPGDRVLVPDRVNAVVRGDRRWGVEGGAAFRPADAGVYYLLADRDTVGALSVNFDPRESDLARSDDASVRALWPGTRVVDLAVAPRVAFRAGARSDLRGPLLWTALLLGFAEVGLASVRRQGR